MQISGSSHHFQDHHHLPHNQLIIIINTIICSSWGNGQGVKQCPAGTQYPT